MITNDGAKNIIELSFNEYITVLLKLGLSVKLIERWKEDLIAYISQQEQFSRDVTRYFELYFCLSDNDIFHHKFMQMSKLENETMTECKIRLDNEINTLLQKLSKVGKEE